jgi:hypothetical protein
MKTTPEICKAIDLKRFLSIIEDLPTIEKITAYNFDLPIMENETKLIKKLCLKT